MEPEVSQRVTIFCRMSSMEARGPLMRIGVCGVMRRFKAELALMRQPAGVLLISTTETPCKLISLSTSSSGRLPKSHSPNCENFLPLTP